MGYPTAGETHHIALTDLTTGDKVGLIGVGGIRALRRDPLSVFTMKTRGGNTKYSDMEPPYSSAAIENWLGGRGQEYLVDTAKYYDSYRMNTLFEKKAILAPLTKFTQGDQWCCWDPEAEDGGFNVASGDVCVQYTPVADISVTTVRFRLKKTGTPTGTLYAQIWSDSGSDTPAAPQIESASATFDVSTLTTSYAWVTFTFGGDGLQLTSGTKYWLFLEQASVTQDASNYVSVGYATANVASVYKSRLGATAYTDRALFYKLNGWDPYSGIGDVIAMAEMGDYVYAATADTGGGQLIKINKSTKVRRVYTAAELGIAVPIVGLLVVNNAILYIFTGSSSTGHVVVKFNGTSFDDEAADTLADAMTYFDKHIMLAKAPTAGEKANMVYPCDPVAWGTDLTLGTGVEVGDKTSAIVGMFSYDYRLYIVKEDSLWVMDTAASTDAKQVPFYFSSQRDPQNGLGSATWKVYAFIPLLYGLGRFATTSIDMVGPDQDAGLPSGRTGRIVAQCPVVNWMYTAIDGGTSGYSSILAYNERGWHEVVRGTSTNQRIRALCYTGGSSGCLWFPLHGEISYINHPDSAQNPKADTSREYATSGYIITSWDNRDISFVKKLYRRVNVVLSDMAGSEASEVTISYQLDEATDSSSWTEIGHTHANGKTALSFPANITGYRIRFKIACTRSTSDATNSPVLDGFAYEYVERPVPNYSWTLTFNIDNYQPSLSATFGFDSLTGDALLAKMDAWAEAASPVTLELPPGRSGENPTTKTVVVGPVQVRYIAQADGGINRVGQFSMYEV